MTTRDAGAPMNQTTKPSERRVLRRLSVLAIGLLGLSLGYDASRPEVVVLERRQTTRAESAAIRPVAEVKSDRGTATFPLPPLDPIPPKSSRGLIDEAGRIASDLATRYPADPDALEMFARYHYWFGDSSEARRAWQTCLESDAGYAYALLGLGQLAEREGDYEQAAKQYRTALEVAPDPSSTQIDLARTLSAQGETDAAIEILTPLLSLETPPIEALTEAGAAWLQKREYQQAKSAYARAVKQDSTYGPAYFGLATAAARLGEVDLARESQEKFREFRQERHERLREQRTEYDDVEAIREDIARTYAEIGNVYLIRGDAAAAEHLWNRAARLFKGNIEARQGLAFLFRQQGKWFDTIRILREIAAASPLDPAYPLEIARIYVRLEREEDAERVLLQLCDDIPNRPEGFLALADFYLQIDRSAEAVPLAERAVDLAPVSEHLLLLSAAHEAEGDYNAALEAMRDSVAKSSEDPRFAELLRQLEVRAQSVEDRQESVPRESTR